MEIGEQLRLRLTMGTAPGCKSDELQPCTVVWIHPKGRFFIVEYRSPITGETFRESIKFDALHRAGEDKDYEDNSDF